MLVLKNLLRRKVRTALSLLGVAIGIAAIIAFHGVADGFERSLDQYGASTGANLFVLERDVPDPQFSRLKPEEVEEILGMEDGLEIARAALTLTTPRGMGVKAGFPALFVFGRNPEERGINRYRNDDLEGRLPREDGEMILGYLAAQKLEKKVGDEMELFPKKWFRIVGIFTVGIPWENVAAVVATRVIQEKLGMGEKFPMGFLYMKDPRTLETLREKIEERFPHLIAVKSEKFAGHFENFEYVEWFVWVISLVSVMIGGLGILNTMIMSVHERTREIGTLRAVGWSCRRVVRMILSEGILLSIFGGLLGIGLGVGGAELILMGAPQGYLGTYYTPDLFAKAMAIAVGLGFFGSLYPALRASRLSPIEALRYE